MEIYLGVACSTSVECFLEKFSVDKKRYNLSACPNSPKFVQTVATAEYLQVENRGGA